MTNTSSIPSFFRAVLHSYAMLFFSQHRGFAAVLLLVTFSHPAAGVAGLAGAALAVAGARLAGFNREWTDAGAYSFNSLLTGLALASCYAPGWALAGLVAVGAALALLLSVALGGWLGGRGLPFLSLPFLLTTWLLLLGSGPLLHLAAAEGSVYWLNDVYAVGGPRLVGLAQWVADWPWPPLLATYLRALGAVLFQDNALAGLLVAGGLLWHSRIAFSLSGLAFLVAYGLSALAGPAAGGLNEYNLGANYLVAAMAVGGVFVIPSAASYGWALGSVPVTVLLLAGLTALLDKLGLPALSLPYCVTALLFLYVLLLRERPGAGLVLTPVQRYSPERNLYAHATDRVRLAHQGAVALTLPFLGAWRCTQGYQDGGPTHLGDWGQALDFAIVDADGRSYQGAGRSVSDFYAYNKPVLAPADGVVAEVVQHIEDNAVGDVNLARNWGNTVVLRHAPGLYTQLSHLRAHSVPVKVGEHVRRGDIVGTCGNSGRSPEPHLHFQVQATPYVGSRTVAYPLAYFVAEPPSRPAGPERAAGRWAGSPEFSGRTATHVETIPENSGVAKTYVEAIPENSGMAKMYVEAIPENSGMAKMYVEAIPENSGMAKTYVEGIPENSGVAKMYVEAIPENFGVAKMYVVAIPENSDMPSAYIFAIPENSGVIKTHVAATPEFSGMASGRDVGAPDSRPRPELRHFAVPVVGETVRPPAFNRTLAQAFRFPPGYALDVRAVNAPDAPAQRWEVFTDAYNLPYLRCHATGAVAYFGGDESVFYFTAFYGSEASWLYLLYRAAYRVPLASLPGQLTTDEFPLTVVGNAALTWAQDFLAPFYRFVKPTFSLAEAPTEASDWAGRTVRLRSRVAVAWFGRERETQTAALLVQEGRISELRVQRAGTAVHLTFSVAGA
ncbi:urea transporter [Hymenobacter ruricola]|uniref:Urea transporter n=1 Tax=Hymenobacter ruricola TaxID=2791023 RepID=A0ABS0HZN3_9BACT|nr:urea transporter [Hymenobacter ruricola]MBF9219764.1 urea transporter [Hymenobacter ruricola]